MRKVGMVDMFPLGLRYVLIFLPIPMFIILYSLLISLEVCVYWIEIIIPIIVIVGIIIYTKTIWAKTIRLTKTNIDNLWAYPDKK